MFITLGAGFIVSPAVILNALLRYNMDIKDNFRHMNEMQQKKSECKGK